MVRGDVPANRLRFAFHAGQAEVEQLRLAVAGDDDVGHLEVAVRDALLEGVVEAGHHVGDDVRASSGSNLPRALKKSRRFCPSTKSITM